MQTGSPLTVLRKKLTETARALRAWAKPLFSNARLQLHMANEIILLLDTAQETRHLSQQESDLRRELKLRILGLAAVERSRRRQASRINHIRAGDACTRFFHIRMSNRKRRKYIASLKRQDGSVVWSHTDKQQVLHEYFQDLLGKKVSRLRTFNWQQLQLQELHQTPGLELDRQFSQTEIEQAIKSLPSEKAPGPDGFTSDFYKHCWHIIKDDILSAFQAFYMHHSGALEHINSARVVLIPKSEIANEPRQFRPISLIHSFAKLLTKVLSIRLSAYIDNLISTTQCAFIKKRCIQNNFMYVRGLARHFHRTKTPACLIKLDITKAFDSISWEFLLELLSRRGFPSRWTDWLTTILRSSSSSIMLNGCQGSEIRHRRGLRQGDPLSPHLFILAIDVLNNIFDLATQHGYLTKLKGRHTTLRISMYADDAVIFTNPDRQDIARIMEIMQAFGEATGLSVNLTKSTVAPIRCSGLDLDEILQDFPGPWVTFPMQYLGLPVTLGRLKLVHLQYIQDRAKSKVAGWQGKLLNVAGCRELVRSVLSTLPVYLLTVIKALKNFLKELDKLRRRFLWAGESQLTGGKCKVSWIKVCSPTPNGGLAIIDLEKFSRALRLRWMWYSWEKREKPWKGMELPLDRDDIALFNAATRVELGNGDKALFWTSRWLHGEAPATMFPSLFKHSKRKNRMVRDALTDKRWIRDMDYNMTEQIITEFVSLWGCISNIALNAEQQDKIIWLHTSDGQYTARSAYNLQFLGMTTSMIADTTW